MSFINTYKISNEVIDNTYTSSICKEYIENGIYYIYTVTRSANGKCIIIKTDNGGNIIWSKEIPDFNIDRAHYSIERTSNTPIEYMTIVNGGTSIDRFLYLITFNGEGSITNIKKIALESISGQEGIIVGYYNNHFFITSGNDVLKIDTGGNIINRWRFSNNNYGDKGTYSFYIDSTSGEMLFFHPTFQSDVAYLVLRDQNFSVIEEVKIVIPGNTGEFDRMVPRDAVFTKFNNQYSYIFSLSKKASDPVFVSLIKTENGSIIFQKVLQDGNKDSLKSNFTLVEDSVYYNGNSGFMKFSISDLAISWAKSILRLGEMVRLIYNPSGNITGYYSDPNGGVDFNYNCKVFHLNKELDSCDTIKEDTPNLPISNELVFSITNDYTSSIETPFLGVNLSFQENDLVMNTSVICEVIGDGQYSVNTSVITANPESLISDGFDNSLITVQLKDSFGFNITTGGETVLISSSAGILSDTTDNGDGTYTANLSSFTTGSATLSFMVNEEQANDTVVVEFIRESTEIPITPDTVVQSPYMYLQSAGSKGVESAKGIHLRWVFADTLGEKHLPKRNLANSTHNFNKPNDVVTIYRTPYIKAQTTLDLSQVPTIIDDINGTWLYRLTDGQEFYVYFKNKTQYNQVRSNINPQIDPTSFYDDYGNEIIEIENKKKMFFAFEIETINVSASSSLEIETMSVPKNESLSVKIVSSRQTYSTVSELSQVRLICEHGRSIRFRASDCRLLTLQYEFYSDFITAINDNNGWLTMGRYGLTLEELQAFNMLEPIPNSVHGHWQRFNDDAYVNIENYKDKWNRDTEEWDRNLKEVVTNYINLSNEVDNPSAVEEVPFENDATEPYEGEYLKVSNLDLLNIAAYDYHIARMLGLGTLDLETVVYTGEYIYLAEYTTLGDLEDGLGAREVKHLSMCLPTSIDDERLPLPVNVKEIKAGAFLGSPGEPIDITDEDGYIHNGESRYVSIYAEAQPTDLIGAPFFENNENFSAHEYTYPIYAGIEYQQSDLAISPPHTWQKPELSYDPDYHVAGDLQHFETNFLMLPENDKPLYVHKQNFSGFHYYSSYGINLFSRATASLNVESIETQLTPKNFLLPPTNIHSLLVKREQPRFLTSVEDQERLSLINSTVADNNDETLVRINFDYHTQQDLITRQVPLDSGVTNEQLINPANANDVTIFYPDDKEIYAEEVDIFFRNEIPNNVSGKVLSIEDHPSEIHISVIETGDYYMASVNETISPTLTPGTESNYIGGIFTIGNQRHVIQSVVQGTEGPIFSVYKKEISDGIINDVPADNAENLQAITEGANPFFMAVENMQNASSWGTPNPLSMVVKIGDNSWPTSFHREVIEFEDEDGNIHREVEKSRGIWSNPDQGHTTVEEYHVPYEAIYDNDGNITGYNTRHEGDYKITFHGVKLYEHPDYHSKESKLNSVDWSGGIVRLFTEDSFNGGSPSATRKVLKVSKIENIVYQSAGVENDLVIYAHDSLFPLENIDDNQNNDIDYDYIQTGNNVSANFYPGYKVYLYTDATHKLTENDLTPQTEDGTHYAIFGLRTRDIVSPQLYASKISVPSLIFNQGIIEPMAPKLPSGSDYATRPDFFGKSTYSVITEFEHKPHGVLFYRSNDEALLNALYEKETVLQIREKLKTLGGQDEEYFADRWKNFLDFDQLSLDGDYTEYPLTGDSNDRYKFPNPDKKALFDWANGIIEKLNEGINPPSPLLDLFNTDLDDTNNDLGNFVVTDDRIFGFVKGAIYNAFVPLTQIPVIYDYINDDSDYKPVNKKQVIRDKNGYVLAPTHPDFEMAPMAKILGTSPHKVQFVDFNLDGTSNNIYFYGVRETGSQMKMGGYSPFLGPVKLVNTNPPEQPEVKRIMPILENQVLGILPSIQLEINAYPEVQNIHELSVYRSLSKLDAQSIRTMKLVKKVDLNEDEMIDDAIWKVRDVFEDLEEVPYNEGIFYRVTVSRKVEYTNKNDDVVTEYQPSQPSKIVASMMVEATTPTSPRLSFTSDPIDVSSNEVVNSVINWEKTCYNGKYHLYKMNSQGNWKKIHTIQSNEANISLPLADTDLDSGTLNIRNENNNPIYHHFKVISENSSGMHSTEEYILSIYQEFDEETGIGRMIIGSSFVVN